MKPVRAKAATKCAVIAGSDGDVGRAVARAFALAGFRTVGLARAGRHTGHVDQFLRVDLSNKAALSRTADRIYQRTKAVHVVVNAAGVYRRTREHAVDAGVFKDNLSIADNVLTVFTNKMKDTDGARVITVASIDGLYGNANSFSYSVAKAAIRALVQLYRKTHRDSLLNFDLISPGAIDTRMRADKAEDKARLLHTDDLAKLCVFLTTLGSHASIDEIVISPKSFIYSI